MTERIIVKFNKEVGGEDASEVISIQQLIGGTCLRVSKNIRAVFEVREDQSLNELIDQIEAMDEVEYCEKDEVDSV